VVVGQRALQVLGQLGGVRVLPHRVQPDQVRLKQNEKPSGRQFWLSDSSSPGQGCGSASFNTDPDPAFHFTVMQIRILLLNKVIKVCDHWSIDPPGLYFEPPGLQGVHGPLRLCFEPRKLPNLNFNADPETKNDTNQCGSGSATLVLG
jgi:hypothetical protein